MSTKFDYDKLAAFDTVVIEYSGSGDEGEIGYITAEPMPEGMDMGQELYRELEEAAYDVLEEKYGAWGDNEGSAGKITINVKERKATIEHGWWEQKLEPAEDIEVE